MTPREIFELYRREGRTRPLEGFALEMGPHLSRYTPTTPGADGLVVFADLSAEHADAKIDEQIIYFDGITRALEWKVHDFDRPSDLAGRLQSRGFASDDVEAFMVLPIGQWSRAAALPAGVRIEPVTTEVGLRDLATVQEAIYSRKFDWLWENHRRALRVAPARTSFYCAYVNDEPIGTGWIDFPEGSSFAELHGGSVLPAYRGRGIFSALLDRRLRDCQSRGYPFVAVDAAPMSRPILGRRGFQHVCWTHPMRRRATTPTA